MIWDPRCEYANSLGKIYLIAGEFCCGKWLALTIAVLTTLRTTQNCWISLCFGKFWSVSYLTLLNSSTQIDIHDKFLCCQFSLLFLYTCIASFLLILSLITINWCDMFILVDSARNFSRFYCSALMCSKYYADTIFYAFQCLECLLTMGLVNIV